MDTRTHDELSIMLDQEEYDDISVAESLISESQRDSEQTVQVFSLSFLSFIFDSFSRISLSLSTIHVNYRVFACLTMNPALLSLATMSLLSVVRAYLELL